MWFDADDKTIYTEHIPFRGTDGAEIVIRFVHMSIPYGRQMC